MTVPNQPWERLYADLKIDLPGATDAMVQQKLFQCVKDFLEQTNAWVEDIPVTGMPNVQTYQVTPAGNGVCHRLQILYDPTIPPPNAPRWVQGGVSMPTPGVIFVPYPPSQQVQWMARIAKNITDPTDTQNYPELDDGSVPGVPDAGWIVDKYRMAFYYGTLARMQASPAKPFTNPNAATDNNRRYITARSQARTDIIKQNTFGGQAWTFPQGYATITRKGWA